MSDHHDGRLHTPGAALVRCTFYARTAHPAGGYTYDPVDLALPPGMFGYPTTCPPAIGDILGLGADLYRVIARQWEYPVYGSAAWPGGQSSPKHVSLTVIVETAQGVFTDEVTR